MKKQIWLVAGVIYAVLMVTINNTVARGNNIADTTFAQPSIFAVLLAAVALIIFIIGHGKSLWRIDNLGFNFDKGFWITASLTAALMIPFFRGPAQVIDAAAFWLVLPFAIYVTANELVIRTGILTYLESKIKNTGMARVITLLITGLVYIPIVMPLNECTWQKMIFSLVMTFIYSLSRSLIIPIYVYLIFFTGAAYAVSGGIMAMIIYAAIGVMGLLISRTNGVDQVKES